MVILASNPKCFGAAARDPRKPCSNRRLRYPVIGGAFVLRDQNHITEAFSSSLGPYLQRKVDALWASGS